MRSLRIVPILASVFLLATAFSAYGQTITYSLLGHERQIGPLEQYLYYQQWSHYERVSHLSHTAQSDSSVIQPIGNWLIPGAIIGGVVGVGLTHIIAPWFKSGEKSDSWEDLFNQIPSGLAYHITSLLIEPLCMASGAHLGNRGRGSFLLDWLLATGSLIVGSSMFDIDLVFDDWEGKMIKPFMVQLVTTVFIEGVTSLPKRRTIQP